MMDVEAFDKPKYCDDDRREFDDDDIPLSKRMFRISNLGMCSSKRDASDKMRDTTTLPAKNSSLCGPLMKSKVSPTPYDDNNDNNVDDDDDHIPLSKCLFWISSLGTFSKRDAYVKKSDTITVPVKRPFDNSNSLCGSMKKSKVSPTPYDDNDNNDNDDDLPISSRIKMLPMSTDKSFSSLKKELALVENSFEECKRKIQLEKKRLHSIKRDIEEYSKELGNKKTQVSCVRRINEIYKKMERKTEECVKDFVAKEGQLYLMEDLIGERKQELKTKEIELRQVMDNISKHKHFERHVKEFESKEKKFGSQVKDLISIKTHFENRMEKLESKEKQHEERVKEYESKEREFEGQMKELKSKNKNFERQVEDLTSKERQLKRRIMELESKEKQLDDRVKEFKSKEDEFEGRVKELESQKKHFESQQKDLELKEKQLEGLAKELQSKEEEFEGQVKEFQSKEEFEGQDTKLKSKKKQFKSQVEDDFKVPAKELKFKERKIKDPKLKLNKFDDEKEFVTSYMDDELSPTIDRNFLQLLPSEHTDIIVNLLESSNPAKIVLDIIQNPIIPRCKKEDSSAVIIDESHIFLLEQLMRISPNIKPCVREEALKLAFDLKANMKENTENSLVILGFLLLLQIYGLVSYFNEDEVFELFAFVVQHKIAVKLFGTLGFANKLSDFVENLIRRKQFDSVVHITWLRRINKYLC